MQSIQNDQSSSKPVCMPTQFPKAETSTTTDLKPQGMWLADIPPAGKHKIKLKLLTIGGVQINGYWKGILGEFYSGWAEYDPALERFI